MKTKCKKYYDNNTHLNNMMIVSMSTWEYDGLPDTLPAWLIETILQTEGTCGVTEINGNLYTGTGGFCGDVINFLPTEYQITNIGVGSKTGKIGEDFVVGFNNSTRTPEWQIMQFADILTEIDTSERCNLLFSRFLRIPKVNDTKEKSAVEQAVKAIMDGRFEALVSKNVLEKIVETGSPDNQFLDLVDVKEVDKLQYLNQYRDNIVKRFYQTYGQGLQSTNKLAQQTSDEIHGNDAVSMIYVLDKLRHRKRFVGEINKKWNTNISVDLSEAWRDQRDEMQEMYSTGDIDETPTEGSGDDSADPTD